MNHRWTASFAYNLCLALGFETVLRELVPVGQAAIAASKRQLMGEWNIADLSPRYMFERYRR